MTTVSYTHLDVYKRQVSEFNYLGYNLSYKNEEDVNGKINKLNQITGCLRRALKQGKEESILKLYKSMAYKSTTLPKTCLLLVYRK